MIAAKSVWTFKLDFEGRIFGQHCLPFLCDSPHLRGCPFTWEPRLSSFLGYRVKPEWAHDLVLIDSTFFLHISISSVALKDMDARVPPPDIVI